LLGSLLLVFLLGFRPSRLGVRHEAVTSADKAYRIRRTNWIRDAMKKLRFLVSLHSCENDFQVAQAQCAEETARKLGIDAEIIFAEDDAVNQSTQLLRAIQSAKDSRPDAIVVEPLGGTALRQVAVAASAAGIGWAVLNRQPEYLDVLRTQATSPIFAVTADHEEIGRIQGRQFSVLLPRGGWILYIEGPSQSSSARKRTEGMLETKQSNIQVSALKGRWTAESAAKAVLSWQRLSTSANARIDLVGAQDDAMAMGARKAFQELANNKERARWLSLPFTGCDGQPATGQVWVRERLLTATVYIPPLTGMAMEILVAAIKNGTQPPKHSMTTSVSIPALATLVPGKH
jgi:ABC-type sugar transport system substrate-binding protein